MCGRYSLYSSNEIRDKFGINVEPNYNISPGNEVLIIDNRVLINKVTWELIFHG